MKHLGFASISAVKQYLRYAEARRISAHDLIKQAGISPELLIHDNGRIKGTQFQALIKRLIELANDPILGLNSSQFVQAQSYNLLGSITLNCETINAAIERIPPFERLVGDMGTTSIQRDEQSLTLTWNCAYQEPSVRQEMVDNVLASWTQFARWLAKQDASAKEVHLTRKQPLPKIGEKYDQVFACPVKFEQRSDCIVLPASMLPMPLQRHSATPLNQLEGQARSQISSLRIENESFTEQVRRSIRAHLQMGTVRKELIAQEFNISLRSVQRRLEQEGCGYQRLLDQARYERALDLLKHATLSIPDIAYNVGYADERCFYRSFKQWSGRSPAHFRQEH